MLGTALGTGNGEKERNDPRLYTACRFIEKTCMNRDCKKKYMGDPDRLKYHKTPQGNHNRGKSEG